MLTEVYFGNTKTKTKKLPTSQNKPKDFTMATVAIAAGEKDTVFFGGGGRSLLQNHPMKQPPPISASEAAAAADFRLAAEPMAKGHGGGG